MFRTCAQPKDHIKIVTENNVLTIRDYVVRFSSIGRHITSTTRHVVVYSQAFVIDLDITIGYTLAVRTRELFFDRQRAKHLGFSKTAPHITSTQGWDHLIEEGPYPDYMFQRLSFLCAQVLINSQEDYKVVAGYSMMRSIASAPSLDTDAEQTAMKRSAAALLAKISAKDMSKAHYVPFYNKDHLVKQLDTYFTEISIYKDDYDRLHDQTTTAAAALKIAMQMNKIHKDTIVGEALVTVQNLEQNYKTDLRTQQAIKLRYDKAYMQLEKSRKKSEEEIAKKRKKARRRAFLGFLFGLARMAVGDFTGFANALSAIKELQRTMNKLSETIRLINTMMAKTKPMMGYASSSSYDRDKLIMNEIEAMVSMRVNIVEWKALRTGSDILMEGLDLKSGAQLRADLAEYCTWGEALTESMVSSAETLRHMLEARAVLNLRKQQEQRSQKVLDESRKNTENRQKMLRVMEEQVFDITMDLNEILMQFCMAYFYETLEPCNANLRPTYRESMKDLLLKINTAKRDGLYIPDVTSTVSRALVLRDAGYTPRPKSTIIFEDEEEESKEGNEMGNTNDIGSEAKNYTKNSYDPNSTMAYKDYDDYSEESESEETYSNSTETNEDGTNIGKGQDDLHAGTKLQSEEIIEDHKDLSSREESAENDAIVTCEDETICPVTYLINHHSLVISLNPDHPDFRDLHKYRVSEIFITLEGLSIPNPAEHMKIYLGTSGLFLDQGQRTFHFATRPIQLAFERELDKTGRYYLKRQM